MNLLYSSSYRRQDRGLYSFFLVIFVILLLVINLLPCLPSFAETAEQKGKPKDAIPIHITSEQMISEGKTNIIRFIGNVVAKKDNIIIYADEVIIYNNKEENRIDNIVATGKVVVKKDGKRAEGEHAVFDYTKQTIIITGNPRAWEGQNEIRGSEMTLYVKEDKIVVKGDDVKKVSVIFYPDKEF